MFVRLFPLWVICAVIAAFIIPDQLTSIQGLVVPLLSLVMLCMGLTLQAEDFVDIAQYKWALLVGMVVQFSVMPIIALLISKALGLSPELTIGMVIVGSVAGGTASNVIALLANGNVALSVSMTAFSTLISILMTPLLLLLLVGSTVEVPAADMVKRLFQIVLLPVGFGVLLNSFFRTTVQKLDPFLAPIAVVVIAILIAIIVALNVGRLNANIGVLAVATLLHNVFGYCLGYLAAKLFGFDKIICRTIAIEVGMQNGGTASVLALKFFTPIVALPAAVFVIWLNIVGSIFAYFCMKNDAKIEHV